MHGLLTFCRYFHFVFRFGTLEFGSYNEIYVRDYKKKLLVYSSILQDAGFNHCKEILREWSRDSHPMSRYITNKKKTLLAIRRSNIDLLEELEVRYGYLYSSLVNIGYKIFVFDV